MNAMFIRDGQAFVMNDEAGQKIAEITFPVDQTDDSIWEADHTWVAPSLRGQGIVSKLVVAVDELAREEGERIKATCPYVITWYERHEDKRDILV